MSADLDDIEVEIKRLPGARFNAVLHTYRRGIGWHKQTRICTSELEAMRWINARMAMRGYQEPYRLAAIPDERGVR